MKYKDVENKIKCAADDIDVPDLLTRVKKAPIKGFMLGGRHTLFRRRAVLALLVLTLIIFAALSIALFAYGVCL